MAIEKKPRGLIMFVLGSLAAIGPFTTDMYLPGFPSIARTLNTDIAHVEFTLTSYFLGFFIGQLAFGPVLDRYGRKKPIVLSLLLYIVAALGCALAASINQLIGLRMLLAVGGCVGIVGSRAVVRDLFSGNEIARALSLLMMIFGIAPIIAPTMGGIVVTLAGWRFIFVCLAFIALLVLVAVQCVLGETKEKDFSVSLRPASIVQEYVTVLKNREFVFYAGAAAAVTGCLFAYIGGSPFVYIDLFGFTATQFGWIYGINACALVAANQVNRMLLKKYDSRGVLLACTVAQSSTALVLLAGARMGFLPNVATMGLILCVLICFGLALPNATALALEPFSRNAGSAAALLGSTQMFAGAASTAMVSLLHDGTPFPMALMIFVSAAVALTLVFSFALHQPRLRQ
jgi:DHA1 family bicyclomycin/chloramphenicol resistance-like MFS transporter